jgi:hypothetical protein
MNEFFDEHKKTRANIMLDLTASAILGSAKMSRLQNNRHFEP